MTSAEVEAFGAKDKDIEIRESHEEAVVSETARVVEEISVGKQSAERSEQITDTVRRTDVDVEQLDASRQAMPPNQGNKQQPPRPQPPR